MERGLWKAAGPSNSRLHSPSSHTDTIDLTGHSDRGYLNRLDNTSMRSQAKIWLYVCAVKHKGCNMANYERFSMYRSTNKEDREDKLGFTVIVTEKILTFLFL